MPFYIKCLIVICLHLPFVLQAQQSEKDSLLSEYAKTDNDTTRIFMLWDLYQVTVQENLEEAKEYALEMLHLSKKHSSTNFEVDAYFFLGDYFTKVSQIDSADFYFQKTVEIYTEKNDLDNLVQTNNRLAILQYDAGNYKKAQKMCDDNIRLIETDTALMRHWAGEYYLKGWISTYQGHFKLGLEYTLKAIDQFKVDGDKDGVARCLINLSATEALLKNYPKALEYAKQALAIFRKSDDKYMICIALSDLGSVYAENKDSLRAKECFEESLKLSKELEVPRMIGNDFLNLATIFLHEKKHEQALVSLNKSLDIFRTIDNDFQLSATLTQLGITYHSIQQPQKALPYYEEALQIASKIESTELLRDLYFHKSKSLQAIGRHNQALENYKLYSNCTDSLFNTTKSQQIEELRILYDLSQKEQEIILQQKEIELLAQKAKANRLMAFGFLLGLIILALGIFGLRQKMKSQTLAKEKIETELEFKKQELVTHALHIAKKNEAFHNLQQQAVQIKSTSIEETNYEKLVRMIDFELEEGKNWESFARQFNELHHGFNTKIKQKYPNVTPNELRLMAFLRMNIPTKEIANILNITPASVKKAKQRLRKKLALAESQTLYDLVLDF